VANGEIAARLNCDTEVEERRALMLSLVVRNINTALTRIQDEDGQALAEYGLLLALVAVACLAAVTALGLAIAGQLGAITGAL
jgi:pilus assembly protein Flp/PilA